MKEPTLLLLFLIYALYLAAFGLFIWALVSWNETQFYHALLIYLLARDLSREN